MAEQSCRGCEFFLHADQATDRTLESGQGLCLRYPPVPVAYKSYTLGVQAQISVNFIHTRVYQDGWCGEYKHRIDADPKPAKERLND